MTFWMKAILLLILVQPLGSVLSAAPVAKPEIENGFNMLYQLRFGEARIQFTAWQQANPRDPLGYVAAAASYLFEEFYFQHVLTSEFFLNDARLLGGIEEKPDETRKTGFETENRRGRELAEELLHIDPQDADALFALTVATGMQADFAAILMKRHLESMTLIKQAEGYANRMLALRPDESDAWLSLGAANYIIGCLPRYKRFFLWFGRIHGDKQLGMEQLRIAAEKGHYLKPFAQIFLALAALRENQEDVARRNLRELVAQFPENPLFRAELARLHPAPENSKSGGQQLVGRSYRNSSYVNRQSQKDPSRHGPAGFDF